MPFKLSRTIVVPVYFPPDFFPGPPEPSASCVRERRSLLGCSVWKRPLLLRLLFRLFLLLLLPVEDSLCQQPLQDGLVHPQLGSHLSFPGYGGDVPAQRAGDGPGAPLGPRRPGQQQQAALAEAVAAEKLPGTPPTRVKGPVTNSALEFGTHVRVGGSGPTGESRDVELPGLIPTPGGSVWEEEGLRRVTHVTFCFGETTDIKVSSILK